MDIEKPCVNPAETAITESKINVDQEEKHDV
jgi:hypothetical protein